MDSQLLIEINYSNLNFATSSLENSLILSILNKSGKLSTDEIVSMASENLKPLGIDEHSFKANIDFYLYQLISKKLIEFKDNKYSITKEGKITYILIDMPLKHVINI